MLKSYSVTLYNTMHMKDTVRISTVSAENDKIPVSLIIADTNAYFNANFVSD